MTTAQLSLQRHSFSKNPILVIDRVGLIGKDLSLKLSKEFPVVFVSWNSLDRQNKNIIHVPFSRKFPVIPDNKYSHIIFIDEEYEDIELLPKIVEKVKDVNADFIFAQGLSTSGEYASEKIIRLCPSAKIVLFGDIFEEKLILRKENFKSTINKFIYQAQNFGRMQILGEGLREAHPVFLNDVVDGLIDLVFGIHKPHSLFYIFPKPGITELSLAHMIQKSNPEVTVDFIQHDPRASKISYPQNGLNLLETKYPLAKKIRSVDIKKKANERSEDFHVDAKALKNFPFSIIWILIALILAPLIFTMMFSFFGLSMLSYTKDQMDKGNFTDAKSSLHLSQTSFYLGTKTFDILDFQAKIIGQQSSLKSLLQDLDLGLKTSEALSGIFNSGTYFSKILNGKSQIPIDDFTKGESSLKNAIIALEKIKAEEKISAPILQKLETINPLIKLLSRTSDIGPEIFGMEEKKTYLILFEDNMELRPGGGLIDSYGILKFDKGKITEFSIHDISDADKQLRGHVEPPFALRRYLPSVHWYMRDSNFNVDFIESALSSSNLFLAETNQKISGVIGVDLSFVKNILHAVGPVYLPEYNETVDENNVYASALSHANKNSSPESMQGKSFLRALDKNLIERITKTQVPYLLIAQAISESIEQKHLIFSLDSSSQNVFTVNGWSSSLWDDRKTSENSINDYLGINEANLGSNKANYFIRKQISQKITIADDGNILEELALNYRNDSTTWPGGDYKNYLRIILPKDTILSGISINDKSQNIVGAVTDPLKYEAKDFKSSNGLEVEKVNQDDKAIFGFFINVPVGKIVKVKFRYTLPGTISGLNNFSYNLRLFKQPGVDSVPYSFSLAYPNSFNIIKSFDRANKGEKNLSYSEKIGGDKNLIIDFAKK